MPVYTNDNGTTKSGWEINANAHSALLDASGLSADRTFTLPDSAGTFFLQGDAGTNYNQLSPAGSPVFQSVKIMDGNNAFFMNLDLGQNLTASRAFSISIGDANRSVAFLTDLSLDQDLSTGSAVSFTAVTAANFNGILGATTPADGTFTLVKAINSATQDAIKLAPRAGGSSNRVGSLTTASLGASRTWTFPDSDGTVVLGGGTCSGTSSGTNTGDQTNISGNAATVTTNANLTGPITSVGNATSIASQTGTGTTFAMSASPTFTGTVTCADFATTGNTTIGDASTDTLTLTAAAWTNANTITITKTAQSSAAETLFTWKVSDSATTFSLLNNNSGDALFAPAFSSVIEQGTAVGAFSFTGTNGTSGTQPALLMLGRYNSGAGNTDLPATTPILTIRNRATDAFTFLGGYNLQFLGGSTSPTIASVAAGDIVGMCGFDRVNTRHAAAANRLLATQSERGSAIYIGDDAIDFAATTAIFTVNATDITFTSTTIAFPQKFTTYNGIATVSNGVPSELATVDLTGQTAAKTATTIYTPAATGMYRISVYLQITTASSSTSILGGATGVVLTYNDGDGNVAQSDTVGLMSTAGTIVTTSSTNTTATNLNGSTVIYARTGVAIQYAIGYTSVGVTPMAYAAHLKVEAL